MGEERRGEGGGEVNKERREGNKRGKPMETGSFNEQDIGRRLRGGAWAEGGRRRRARVLHGSDLDRRSMG